MKITKALSVPVSQNYCKLAVIQINVLVLFKENIDGFYFLSPIQSKTDYYSTLGIWLVHTQNISKFWTGIKPKLRNVFLSKNTKSWNHPGPGNLMNAATSQLS